jgi:4-carboxymuconolactone decarboxylase
MHVFLPLLVAEARGLPDDKIATIVAGQRPSDLSREEAVAYDLAAALVSGGLLPELTYRPGGDTLQREWHGRADQPDRPLLPVSVTLNGFDVPVPDDVRS